MTMTKVVRNKENYITTLTSYSEALVNKGEESLEVFITSAIAEGTPILDICRELNFPAVHILSWLQKEHNDLLVAAETIHKDKSFDNLSKETDTFDESNYKHKKAGSDIKLNVLKNRKLVKQQEERPASGGMNFAINVVVPNYAKKDESVVEVIENED